MPKTLNHDEFMENDKDKTEIEPYTPHNILYGKTGWTDGVDDATIDLLMRVGAVRLDRTHSGIGWETRIYISNEGTGLR